MSCSMHAGIVSRMKPKARSVGRQAFIKCVLDMLDEGASLDEINLRHIAKRLGCAHTNAYNWFASQQELYWWALGLAIERLLLETQAEDIPPLFAEDGLLVRYAAFARRHPAWFRLIWLERLTPPIPDEIVPLLARPSCLMGRSLKQSVPAQGSLQEKGDVLFSYLHGKLCLLVTHRMSSEQVETLEQDLLSFANSLFC
ncbi:hypothetical protein SDC9_119270 [bioreactor metagenome]|uniref:HTH tetR-type domain-containing protein n=1 Tax=bioreactor metagenome TaxID=1076179 RepID=A0A645C522_9ZZZZ